VMKASGDDVINSKSRIDDFVTSSNN